MMKIFEKLHHMGSTHYLKFMDDESIKSIVASPILHFLHSLETSILLRDITSFSFSFRRKYQLL